MWNGYRLYGYKDLDETIVIATPTSDEPHSIFDCHNPDNSENWHCIDHDVDEDKEYHDDYDHDSHHEEDSDNDDDEQGHDWYEKKEARSG